MRRKIILLFLFLVSIVTGFLLLIKPSAEQLPSTEVSNYEAEPASEEYQFSEPTTVSDVVEVAAKSPFGFGLLVDGRLTQAERDAFEEMAQAYRTAGGQDRSENRHLLNGFLNQFPDGSLRISVLNEKAQLEWRHGFFVDALYSYESAWSAGKELSTVNDQRLAQDTLASYMTYLARMGQREKLRELIDSLDVEALGGHAAQAYSWAKEKLWFFEQQPEQNVFCGFTAANTICVPLGFQLIFPDVHDPEEEREFVENGLSLYELRAHSHESDGDLKIYKRVDPAAAIPVPSVVHWNFGHYSAVTETVGGRLRIDDKHMRVDTLMADDAFEEQFSGYLLASAQTEMPNGYIEVGDEEAQRVFGRHCVHGLDIEGFFGGLINSLSDFLGLGGGTGCPMAEYSFRLFNPGLEIVDTPISYVPPVGPAVSVLLNYDQRSAVIADSPLHSNFGPRWSHNLLTFVDLTGTPVPANGGAQAFPSTTVSVAFGSGDFFEYFLDTEIASYTTKYPERPKLIWDDSGKEFTLEMPDGSAVVYAQANLVSGATRYYATAFVDAQGNQLTLAYDASLRITSVTDALGQETVFSYVPGPGDQVPTDIYKIRSITDPFGRAAFFKYTATGQLYQIVDPIGIVSEFAYTTGDFIDMLTTPYGSTTFEWGDLPGINDEPGRYIQATNPQGDKERAERYDLANFPAAGSELLAPSAVAVGDETVSFLPKVTNLFYRNTYYWDKQQMRYGAGDYSKATIYNWQAQNDVISPVLASYKEPLESRIWFNYLGQISPEGGGDSSRPSKTLRAVEDKDGVTQWALSRSEYHPVSGKVTRTIGPLGRELVYEYNDDESVTGAVSGIDLTAIKVKTASGYETLASFGNFVNHLPQSTTNAAGQTTIFAYNSMGQVTSITDPNGGVSAYAYDSDGYLLSVDGPLAGTGDTIQFTYDAAGRMQTVTDYDGYVLTYSHDDIDRLTRVDYPDGTHEAYTYDKLDMATARDRLGRLTNYTYDELRQLTAATDPENRTVGYDWCRCGDLRSLIDPMGRVTRWHRDVQGRVTAKEYVDGSQVRYEYDLSGQLSQRIDEKGQITRYRYNIDSTLHATLYPNAENPTPTVSYTYDSYFNRVTSMSDGIGITNTTYHPIGSLGANEVASVDGPWANDVVNYSYDALGRLTNRSINGVAQTMSYDAASRLQSVVNPLGTFTYTHDGVTSRLASVTHNGGVSAEFDYFGNAQDNRLQTITNQTPANAVISKFDYTYDAIGRITEWTQQMGTNAAAAEVWTYGYDDADQLTSAEIAVNGSTTKEYAWAYDPAANRLSETVDSATETFVYNALNQLDSSSMSVAETSYEWDAEDRLIAVIVGDSKVVFSYDGLGRCASIKETLNEESLNDQKFLWLGLKIIEERNADGSKVEKQYFSQGCIDISEENTLSLFSYDHLGSLREIMQLDGTVSNQMRYSVWGNSSSSHERAGVGPAYGTHFEYFPSKIILTMSRIYDPRFARWLSRDPIGEGGGTNLYAYSRNSPIALVDMTGLDPIHTSNASGLAGDGSCERNAEQFVKEMKRISDERCPETIKEFAQLARDCGAVPWHRDDFLTKSFQEKASPGTSSTVGIVEFALPTGEGFECAYSYAKDEFGNHIKVRGVATFNNRSAVPRRSSSGIIRASVSHFFGDTRKKLCF
ncbi:MAG: RHS repeat-associated core domain-containing protein [Verrucomicrobiota bacterium]